MRQMRTVNDAESGRVKNAGGSGFYDFRMQHLAVIAELEGDFDVARRRLFESFLQSRTVDQARHAGPRIDRAIRQRYAG